LDELRLPTTASLVDVGAGASTLVDALLQRGWSDLTLVDISEAALRITKERLGPLAGQVQWEVADITSWTPKRAYDVWHDRAVFHFLAEEHQRQDYRRALEAGLTQGGRAVIATFAPDGPERCSGLPIRRHDEQALAGELGPRFRLLRHWREEHRTPGGAVQAFNWCVFEKAWAPWDPATPKLTGGCRTSAPK
jgi:trans-aconitate methyltransferase